MLTDTLLLPNTCIMLWTDGQASSTAVWWWKAVMLKAVMLISTALLVSYRFPLIAPAAPLCCVQVQAALAFSGLQPHPRSTATNDQHHVPHPGPAACRQLHAPAAAEGAGPPQGAHHNPPVFRRRLHLHGLGLPAAGGAGQC